MQNDCFNFKLEGQDGKARAGEIATAHGNIQTPVFMPVGTRATVKTLTQQQLLELDPAIILGNTYHLYLRPGHELIERVGDGLHGFMAWPRAILTDSGGFQIFSLSELNKINDEGVKFQSHIDGSFHMITPERSMEIQRALGSDIVMAFDQCPPLPSTPEALKTAVERTLLWANRCCEIKLRPYQALFGIIQGGLDLNLRHHCMQALLKLPFAGFALGGLSVGEKNQEMVDFLDNFVEHMPKDRPRYLMGVGTPLDIIQGVRAGLDMFDCVLPTRNARNGQAITHAGPLSIKRGEYKEDKRPLDPMCRCQVCGTHSRSYIRHLYMVNEYTAGTLLTYHNIHFYLQMMREIRSSIMEKRFDDYCQEFYKSYICTL
ncbi:MAG: tRNA guanosine(34) transglycosylase Tgt [Bdellovibrio sp.]|nr:tRNA guanosine(34) transglycosylase Tgt [Bdellovibrio sp.]